MTHLKFHPTPNQQRIKHHPVEFPPLSVLTLEFIKLTDLSNKASRSGRLSSAEIVLNLG